MKKICLLLVLVIVGIALIAQTTQEHPLKNGETLPLRTTGVQVINIPQGWSSISGYILPEDTDIETLFQAAIEQLIIVQNLQGIYYPDIQVNTLENWDATSGYMVKFSGPATFELEGDIIADKTLNLASGWNLIPVISTCPVDVVELFDEVDLAIVKEVAGLNVYWPEMNVATLLDLLPGSAYFVYLNSPGVITFPECGWECGDPLSDTRDGQTYTTVQIGDQCWMAENLNIGTRIDGNNNQTDNDIIEKYCYYNYEFNCDFYGGLYKWDEMMGYTTTPGVQGICPEGWHVPSDAQWTALTTYVSNQMAYLCNSNTNYIAKALAAKTNWNTHPGTCTVGNNLNTNNATNFTGLPGGNRGTDGTFDYIGNLGNFWSSTEKSTTIAWARHLLYFIAVVGRDNGTKGYGLSVRCLRDETAPPPTYNLNLDVQPTGAGTVNGAGQYEAGQQVNITTEANAGWEFVNWTNDDGVVSEAANFTYTMLAEDVTLTANFVEEQTGFTCGDALVDSRDGQSYETVQIGDQCWMAENLAFLPEVSPSSQGNNTDPYYYVYGYQGTNVAEAKATANYQTYGALYNWPASLNACPTGWHLTTDAEWTALTTYVSNQPEYLCNSNTSWIAKSLAATTNWLTHSGTCTVGNNLSANNATGFSGLPGGYRNTGGSFDAVSGSGNWWSATEFSASSAWFRHMGYGDATVYRGYVTKGFGFSARCLRDNVRTEVD